MAKTAADTALWRVRSDKGNAGQMRAKHIGQAQKVRPVRPVAVQKDHQTRRLALGRAFPAKPQFPHHMIPSRSRATL